jgi:SAM-dependent methyltransferase
MAHLATRREASAGEAGAATELRVTPRLWDAAVDAAADAPPLLDIRAAAAQAAVHLGACLCLPHAEYADRSLELPPRGTVVRVLVDTTDAACMALAATLPLLPSEVAGWFDGADAAFWASVEAGAIHAGGVGAVAVVRGHPPDPTQQPQLWQPGPVVAPLLAALRDAGLACGAGSECTCARDAPVTRLLDAGSGTGRNAVYVARHCRRLRVVAVDNRRAMIEKLSKFAARAGVHERVTGLVADVMAFVDGRPEGFHAVLAQRFTHKPFFCAAATRLLPPAPHRGWLAVESFAVGASHPTDRAQLVAPGEMAELLSAASTTSAVVHESVVTIADGRPLLLGVYAVSAPAAEAATDA